ncbi:hypothetical protein Cgig2_009056 [Carnegiea gigantea]|uniref:Uncharacterized protein n=1 Tax=Carnegiea gigantea TaxID=171969 RepID=A0A9Q1KL68_9CARY|nr:hypothetical protein Cgig2_009056 [Carnegiea gigantea]
MAFPRSLDTKAMSEFVIRCFLWERRGKALPLSPLPKDFRSICSDFDLTTAEQAAAHYELPELPQAIFYAMLLNEAGKLGVLHGPRLRSLEVALTELRWGASESWIWLFGDRVYEVGSARRAVRTKAQGPVVKGRARIGWPLGPLEFPCPAVPPQCFPINTSLFSPLGHYRVYSHEKLSVTVCAISMAFPPTHSTREMANYVRETFTWHWRSASCLPRPLPEDFNVLCLYFSLAEAEAGATESELPEIV